MNKKIWIVIVVIFLLALGGGYFYRQIIEDRKIEVERAGWERLEQQKQQEEKERIGKHRDIRKKLRDMKSAQYVVTFPDGKQCHEIFTPDLLMSVSPTWEVYADDKWHLEIDKVNKTYIIEEKLDHLSYDERRFTSVLGDLQEKMIDMQTSVIDGNTILYKDNSKLVFNEEDLPVEFYCESDTFYIQYLPVEPMTSVPFPDALPDYAARILTDDNYRLGDQKLGAGIDRGYYNRKKIDEYPDYFYGNYTGIIEGERVHVYIQGDKNKPDKWSVLLFYENEEPTCFEEIIPAWYSMTFITGGMILKDAEGETLFKGELTDNQLKGELKDKKGGYIKVDFRRPPLSATSYPFLLKDIFEGDEYIETEDNWDTLYLSSFRVPRRYYYTDYIEADIFDSQLKAFKMYVGRNNHNMVKVYCNELGILSLTLEHAVYNEVYEDELMMYERQYRVYDLITGDQIYGYYLLKHDFRETLKEMGYPAEDFNWDKFFIEENVFILPTGILFTESGDNGFSPDWKRIFVPWQDTKELLKPFGSLHPFLVRAGVETEQPGINKSE